jgi:hypothetical protein
MKIFAVLKSLWYAPFALSLYSLDAFPNVLSGTVRDSSGVSVIGALVGITGKGAAVFADSSITDSSGAYSMQNFPIGIYSFSVTKASYWPFQEDVLLGDASLTKDVVLSRAPSGTHHQGLVSGNWEPAGNPHLLTDDIHVRDSLYIMPGCSVTCPNNAYCRIILDSGVVLRIGGNNGVRTFFTRVGFASYSDSGRVYLENAKIDSAYNVFYSGKTLKIDSSVFSSCDFGDIKPSDSLIISRSAFYGKTPRCYTNHGGGAAIDPLTVTNIYFKGGCLEIDQSQFYMVNLYIGDCISLSYVNNNFRQFTCSNTISTAYAGGLYLQSSCRKAVLSHNNIDYLNCYASRDSISVQDNIIGKLSVNNESTQYESPFSYNIIASLENTTVFGLDQNIRTNKNGDSCDLWYNIKADPLFFDTSHTALLQNSPAIGAASDGTNIGYYQGDFIAVKRATYHAHNARPVLSASCIKNTLQFSLHGIKTGSALSLLIFRPDGKKVLKQPIGAGSKIVIIDGATLPDGCYIAALKSDKALYGMISLLKR